jgi:hypothetical protein
MRRFLVTAVLLAWFLGFAGVLPSEARSRSSGRALSNATRNGKSASSRSHTRSSSKYRYGSKAGISRRRRSSRNFRYSTQTYRFSPGASSSSFPPSLNRYSSSEFLVWPNGL